ncbi:hypothetical protein HK097_000054 [Rhizophlyctis rosea]|uniref:Uncharacterized protein n=1 Tax=Rhizophlyctis rosea TaxID=64517 RepID=A0AAD5X994_9FUNG|nr:hypothetical protein HK097_000054 [Rhizophlyctis rosea]
MLMDQVDTGMDEDRPRSPPEAFFYLDEQNLVAKVKTKPPPLSEPIEPQSTPLPTPPLTSAADSFPDLTPTHTFTQSHSHLVDISPIASPSHSPLSNPLATIPTAPVAPSEPIPETGLFGNSDSDISDLSSTASTSDSDSEDALPLTRRKGRKREANDMVSESELSTVSSVTDSNPNSEDETSFCSSLSEISSGDDGSDFNPGGSKGRSKSSRRRKLKKRRRRRHVEDSDEESEVEYMGPDEDPDMDEHIDITPFPQLNTPIVPFSTTDPYYDDWIAEASSNSVYVDKALPPSYPRGYAPSRVQRVPLYTLSGNGMIMVKNKHMPNKMEPVAYVFSGEKYGLGADATQRLTKAVDGILDSNMDLPRTCIGKRFGAEKARAMAPNKRDAGIEVPSDESETEEGDKLEVKGRGVLLNIGVWEWKCFTRNRYAVSAPTDYDIFILNHLTYGFQSLLTSTGSVDRLSRRHNFVDPEDHAAHSQLVSNLPPLSRALMHNRPLYPTLINNWNVLTRNNHVDANGFKWTVMFYYGDFGADTGSLVFDQLRLGIGVKPGDIVIANTNRLIHRAEAYSGRRCCTVACFHGTMYRNFHKHPEQRSAWKTLGTGLDQIMPEMIDRLF